MSAFQLFWTLLAVAGFGLALVIGGLLSGEKW